MSWKSLGCDCTDNTFFSAVSSSEEHARAAAIDGMTPELLLRAVACGHEAAFSRS